MLALCCDNVFRIIITDIKMLKKKIIAHTLLLLDK